jgi:hypothetical protein
MLGLPGAPVVAAGADPVPVAAADLNGDGKPDLAVTNQSGDSVSVLLNKGNGTFAARIDYFAGPTPSSIAVADLNGDSALDLAVTNESLQTVSVLFSTCLP